MQGNDGATVQHWHANKLGGMAFAPRSEVLFSGGLESVLVKWLGSEPQFLPRIGQGFFATNLIHYYNNSQGTQFSCARDFRNVRVKFLYPVSSPWF